jgi:hypothetical protein
MLRIIQKIVCVCVCVCVRERERERERAREHGTSIPANSSKNTELFSTEY